MKAILTIIALIAMARIAIAAQRLQGAATAPECEISGEIILTEIEAEIDDINRLKNELKAIEDLITEIELQNTPKPAGEMEPEGEQKKAVNISWTTAAGNNHIYDLNISGNNAAAKHLLNAAYYERTSLRHELKNKIEKLYGRCNANSNANYNFFDRGGAENAKL
jgi:hypothetical protein